jgi:hypothetical protein
MGKCKEQDVENRMKLAIQMAERVAGIGTLSQSCTWSSSAAIVLATLSVKFYDELKEIDERAAWQKKNEEAQSAENEKLANNMP